MVSPKATRVVFLLDGERRESVDFVSGRANVSVSLLKRLCDAKSVEYAVLGADRVEHGLTAEQHDELRRLLYRTGRYSCTEVVGRGLLVALQATASLMDCFGEAVDRAAADQVARVQRAQREAWEREQEQLRLQQLKATVHRVFAGRRRRLRRRHHGVDDQRVLRR